MMTFGQNLKYIRKQKGLSQINLGALIGVSGTAIGKLEVSSKTPKKETVVKLADALGVNPAELDPDLDASVGETAVYRVQKGSAEDRALEMCRTLSKASLEYWFAIGDALAEFPENRR